MGKNSKAINTPLITVYITNHNYGKFINKAIKSVLNQSIKNLIYDPRCYYYSSDRNDK